MGHPRKQRKKYARPLAPWQKQRIEDEKKIIEDFGLKNKKEIWKAEFMIRKIKSQAKSLIAKRSEQAEKEKKDLMERLFKLNLLPKTAKLDDVLDLKLHDILNRRLQTIVFKKGMARSVKQARQFITHGHVYVNERIVNVPSYLIIADEETKITFNPNSSIFNPEHPERVVKKPEVKTQMEVPKKEEKLLETQETKKVSEPKEKEVPKKEKKKEEKKEEEVIKNDAKTE